MRPGQGAVTAFVSGRGGSNGGVEALAEDWADDTSSLLLTVGNRMFTRKMYVLQRPRKTKYFYLSTVLVCVYLQ